LSERRASGRHSWEEEVVDVVVGEEVATVAGRKWSPEEGRWLPSSGGDGRPFPKKRKWWRSEIGVAKEGGEGEE
jgi:hypothetical protein